MINIDQNKRHAVHVEILALLGVTDRLVEETMQHLADHYSEGGGTEWEKLFIIPRSMRRFSKEQIKEALEKKFMKNPYCGYAYVSVYCLKRPGLLRGFVPVSLRLSV